MELLQPVQGVGHQEVAHLGTAVVEDQRAPVRVLAALRVGVLVQRRAVEPGQRPRVAGEVRGHPVEQHADAGLMQPVDEQPELIRRAEPGRRRVIRRHLIAPGAAERVLGDRQDLDVREAELGDVVRELVGELGIGQPGPPRAEVHLVHAHRLAQRIPAGPGGQPVIVAPLVAGLADDGCGVRRRLRQRRHRVGLALPGAVRPADLELVPGALADPGHEDLPDARSAERAHRMGMPVPEIEVPDHPHAARVRRPDGE